MHAHKAPWNTRASVRSDSRCCVVQSPPRGAPCLIARGVGTVHSRAACGAGRCSYFGIICHVISLAHAVVRGPPSQSIMLGAGQGAAAGSNATHDVARKAAIAGAGAGSGGAETGAGSPSVRSPPSTAHASRECTLPAPPAARAGTPAAAASKQAQLAASFEAKSAQLLQQFVAFRSQRTLSTDDRCLGWGRKFVSPQPAAIRRFQCRFTPAAVRNIGCPPCSTDGCSNFGTEVCYNCESSLCIVCDDCRHGSGGGLPCPHLHRRVTYRHGYEQQKCANLDSCPVWPELPPRSECPTSGCKSTTYRRLPWGEPDGGVVRVLDLGTCHDRAGKGCRRDAVGLVQTSRTSCTSAASNALDACRCWMIRGGARR